MSTTVAHHLSPTPHTTPTCFCGASDIISYQSERLISLIHDKGALKREKEYYRQSWDFLEGEVERYLDERMQYQHRFNCYMGQLRAIHQKLAEGIPAGEPGEVTTWLGQATKLNALIDKWMQEEDHARETWRNMCASAAEGLPHTPLVMDSELGEEAN